MDTSATPSASRAIEVVLTPKEYLFGGMSGYYRQAANRVNGCKDKHKFSGDGYGVHVEGAVGELVVAKWLNVYWGGASADRKTDVGGVQVRWTRRHTNRLIIHPEDYDDAPYVLVTGDFPRYLIHGWILGRDAKRKEWWSDPTKETRPEAGSRPAFFVPQAALNDPAALRQLLKGDGHGSVTGVVQHAR